MKLILLSLVTLSLASGAFAADNCKADIYGNTDKDMRFWKHQPVWKKDVDGITFWERASCAHERAYPYVYCKPPCKADLAKQQVAKKQVSLVAVGKVAHPH